MKLPRWLRRLVTVALGLGVVLGAVIGAAWWWLHPACETTPGIVYAQRKGRDLTFDILRPARPNGLGVLVMVSGGWRSGRIPHLKLLMAPLLRHGYTIFAVTHGSQPQFTVMEIVADVQRAARFIRHRAREYGVDPDRLGVTGGSSGGHLSLMLATRPGSGPGGTADPVERESSAVQAVACFYPATDLLNLGRSTENPGNGGPPKSFVRAFGPNSTNLAVWRSIGREMSPIYHITTNLPPVLIIHGDADTLVPLDQSERFAARAREAGRIAQIEVRPGKKHGWLTMVWDVRHFADWFDRWLRPAGP
jgi:acetyl esterase/lipase